MKKAAAEDKGGEGGGVEKASVAKKEEEAAGGTDDAQKKEAMVKDDLMESVRRLGTIVRAMCKQADSKVLSENGFKLAEERPGRVGEEASEGTNPGG